MKKSIITLLLGLCSSVTWAGPVAEIYTCELNEGKTLADVNNMMSDFSQMLKKAGLQDAYTVYVGFQQLPIRHNSDQRTGQRSALSIPPSIRATTRF